MKPTAAAVLNSEDIPQVALDSMNQTHREEVELINQLGTLLNQAMAGEANAAAISSKLEEWVEHTREHFERENHLMLEHGFPAHPVHSGEHQNVLAHIEELRDQWQAQEEIPPLARFILEEWPRWFHMHVTSMDTVTAQFISQQTG